jgi:hypothetical protein
LSLLIELYGGATALALWEAPVDHVFINNLIDTTAEFRKTTANEVKEHKNKLDPNKVEEQSQRKKVEAGLDKLMGSLTKGEVEGVNGEIININHLIKGAKI